MEKGEKGKLLIGLHLAVEVRSIPKVPSVPNQVPSVDFVSCVFFVTFDLHIIYLIHLEHKFNPEGDCTTRIKSKLQSSNDDNHTNRSFTSASS